MITKNLVKLSEYKPYPFLIPDIELEFIIKNDFVIVSSCMKIIPLSTLKVPLILNGHGLDLQLISINSIPLEASSYLRSHDGLEIFPKSSKPFLLRTTCKLYPSKNTALEGLYMSGDVMTTQCEAEGFRRICFHPDRPDVLSKYKVRIEADIKTYPVLLSNGNLIENNILDENTDRHQVVWHDPYPKPSYLFAFVAGSLRETNSSFVTKSGRKVNLRLHVEPGDEQYTSHAMNSLKLAMAWEEKEYGLEYDLDEYNIVAIRHFNMGAMENKSLNIFNSKLILADIKTATDSELERIESVIAHEYFHNWTGNRITCRDWFQLSLKEGLTVFRDQSFTSDNHSHALKRIEDVSQLRNTQFREDMGPTSHPVKPTEYLAIDNFYTTTIYEKGAEIIRMLYTLFGHKRFMSGMNFYIQRFDGKAATTEDFLQSMFDGAKCIDSDITFDMEQFSNWYYVAGTPFVDISYSWNRASGELTICFKQSILTNNEKNKGFLFVIPIELALVTSKGKILEQRLVVLKNAQKEITIKDLPLEEDPPAISVFRGFSAPVKWNIPAPIDKWLNLFMFDDDPFSRWEAGQFLVRKVFIARSSFNPDLELEKKLVLAFDHLISTFGENDPGILTSLLTSPGLSELEALQEKVDPIRLYQSNLYLMSFWGTELSLKIKPLLEKYRLSWQKPWPSGQGERMFISLAWSWLAIAGDISIREEALKFMSDKSMTMARAALSALYLIECPQREIAMKTFYDLWKDRPVILDSWFALEASIYRTDSLVRIENLLSHPRFDSKSPNTIRALLGGLMRNIPIFHAPDGSGYEFMAEQLIVLDKINPITASRLVKVFSRWKSYINPNKDAMYKVINKMDLIDLSKNTREVIDLIKT